MSAQLDHFQTFHQVRMKEPFYGADGYLSIEVPLVGKYAPEGVEVWLMLRDMPKEMRLTEMVTAANGIAKRVQEHFEPEYRAGGFGPIDADKDKAFRRDVLDFVKQNTRLQPVMLMDRGAVQELSGL